MGVRLSGIGRARIAAGTMVFLGAFLSFGMEPIAGRLITPFYGGSAHVWITSLMVFQALLLMGYFYAHIVATRIGYMHLILLMLPVIQLPLSFISQPSSQPSIIVLIPELLRHFSLLFVVLCTSAVVAQSWWHNSSYGHVVEPYTLYAVSNAGSLLALLTYPFIVEPLLGLGMQRWVWSVIYLLYIIVACYSWFQLRPRVTKKIPIEKNEEHALVDRASVIHWLILSATPSALLLALTNVIAMEVGSFPLVWVVPLALYLTSFILAFRNKEGFFERLGEFLPELALLALGMFVFSLSPLVLFLTLFVFFALCVSSHKQLYRLRPHPQNLTTFFLIIAIGGWLGGMLVSLVAPVTLSGLQDYPLAVIGVVIAGWITAKGVRFQWWKVASIWKGSLRLYLLILGGVVVCSLWWLNWDMNNVYSMRNFYGTYRIQDKSADKDGTPAFRMLLNGSTIHGMQYLDQSRAIEPLSYYHTKGFLYQSLDTRERPAKVALVGLGAGAALSWFNAKEQVTVYELDPDIVSLSRKWFSYIHNSSAQIKILTGDARLNLLKADRDTPQRYDVIFVDAFSGDGVPTHLLTSEALEIYLGRLAEDGLLVFHITNRYFDLKPVLKAESEAHGLSAAYSTNNRTAEWSKLYSDQKVVVMARNEKRISSLIDRKNWVRMGNADGLPKRRPWTDDYINMLAPLWDKWGF